jgi:hypothetical protein
MDNAWFAASQQHWMGFWKKALEGQQQRAEAALEEWAKVEGKGLEQVGEAALEVAKLTKETLAYQARLGTEWRKLWLDGLRMLAEQSARAA